MTPPARSAR